MKYRYEVKSGFAIDGVFYTSGNADELSNRSHESLLPYIEAGLLVATAIEPEPAPAAPTTPSKKR